MIKSVGKQRRWSAQHCTHTHTYTQTARVQTCATFTFYIGRTARGWWWRRWWWYIMYIHIIHRVKWRRERTRIYRHREGANTKRDLARNHPYSPRPTPLYVLYVYLARRALGIHGKIKKNTHSHTRGDRPFRPFVHYRVLRRRVYIICVCVCVYCIVFVLPLFALKISRNLKPFFILLTKRSIIILRVVYIYNIIYSSQ
jgi:hypothetical protein